MGKPDRFGRAAPSERQIVRAALAKRLATRNTDRATTVLGAGSDDLEAGRAYLRALADGGWAVPTWPTEHGGLGASGERLAMVQQELARFEVPDLYPFLVGLTLVGPTLLEHGDDAQRARWLPGIKDGTEIWCQLFSEPDAGSDLAGLATRARQDGDEWIVDGQKVWTSRGHYARRGLLLARSDPSVPKHAGITAFGLDLHAPGVDVRPLRQMNGDTHFTEVFLDGVRVHDRDRIGPVGGGWKVALTTLAHERGGVATPGGAWLDEQRLVALARELGLHTDPLVRQQLTRVVVELRVAALTVRRARARAKAGRPGPEGSGQKLRAAAAFRDFTNAALALLGPAAVAGAGARNGEWQTLFLTAPSLSIRGGTDEIQRNIVGEHVLGLPSEPRVDRNMPFDQSPRASR
ncbi:MAG TPA: acyl-CoA dehydrogenase family protein [Acidimicrobiia bacterium]|nr:acyl-CoA dehydrogenase family protein [Acidimicrobiia bacterium]